MFWRKDDASVSRYNKLSDLDERSGGSSLRKGHLQSVLKMKWILLVTSSGSTFYQVLSVAGIGDSHLVGTGLRLSSSIIMQSKISLSVSAHFEETEN